MGELKIVEGGPDDVDAAALIWAHAVAVRDGYDEVPTVEQARPGVERALAEKPSLLLLALDGERPVGFVAGGRQAEGVAFVNYVGVHPDAWGKGVAQALLGEFPGRFATLGYTSAELMVYLYNERAVRLYEHLGWRAVGAPTPQPENGKLEQRYALALGQALPRI